jgi:hypothetical protein
MMAPFDKPFGSLTLAELHELAQIWQQFDADRRFVLGEDGK